MATLREFQGKAKKMFVKWKKEYAKVTDKDRRSPVSHLCMTVLMRNNSITNAHKAEQALRARFIDWNEIRVSPVAEVVEVLEDVGTPHAEQKAYALRRYYIEDSTLEEIAGELGVSKERVRQIREAGEKKLRSDYTVLSLWQSIISQRRR